MASSASALTSGKFTYEVLNGTEIEITGYPTTEVGEVTIPAEIDSKPVVLIEFQAFLNCVGITRIIIPDSVRAIDIWAFEGCSSLSEISVGPGNTSYSSVDGVLLDKAQTDVRICPQGKTGAYTIPSTVSSVGWSAFDGCSKLTSVTIPSGVTSIGNTAFRGCSDLTSLTIPNSVTDIGSGALAGCSDLASVTLPSNITSISPGMFGFCTSLNNIIIPSSVTDIGSAAFYSCSNLISITVPSGVTTIGKRAFAFCNQLTTVNIPSGITSIADETFWGCNSLANVTIPNGVMSIGKSAFSFTKLASVTLPSVLTSIGEEAFRLTQLTSITIPDSVTEIGPGAFADCGDLASVTLPSNIASISPGMFSGCTSLNNITIPSSVTDIGSFAFSSCNNLTSITIPSGVIGIGTSAFSFCRQLTTINIPSGVASIADETFISCSSLTSITIPNGVTSIGDRAFKSTGLPSITLPATLTSIGEEAFSSSQLTSVAIPDSVTSIGARAFEGSSFLTTTYFAGDAPTTFGANVFDNVAANHSIYYRNDATGYSSPTWNGYTATMIKFGYVVLGDGTIEITNYPTSETGPVFIPFSIEQKTVTRIGGNAFSGCKDITSITIPDGVSIISQGAFDGCDSLLSFSVGGGNTFFSTPAGVLFNKNQTTLIRYPLAKTGSYSIPNSVTTLANEAFKNCKSLSYFTIPSGVTMIGNRVFSGCNNLIQTYFAGNAPASFGTQVFDGAAPNHRIYYTNTSTGFTSPTWNGYASERLQYSYVVVGGTSIRITDYPTSATGEIVIPDFIDGKPVTSIGSSAFSGCGSLTSIGIPESVTSIGEWAFADCTSLTEIKIPKNTTSLGDGAFFGCTGLTYVIIPASVNAFGSFVFEGCSNLAATYFAGNAPADGINMFEGVALGHTIYYLDTSTGFSGSWSFLAPQAINTVTYPAASWLLNAYIIYDTPLSQDLNSDGVSLLMAYALNLDPHERLTNKLPKVVFSSTKLELTHYIGRAGVTYHVETSKNLVDWVETGVTTTAPDINGMVTASINRDQDCGFLRLVVKLN
ncbi:MAG: leucine-rich repeat domain-containing protein [Akkermansiaceae bacterium]